MKATPSAQLRLLDLLAVDTRLNQLDHQRRSLPELVAIEQLEARVADLDSEVIRTETAVADLDRQVAKAEAAVQQVRDRAARNQSRLDAGVGSAKDLQGMQHELESLARRQQVLEDEELALMETAEQARLEVGQAATAQRESQARLAELIAARDEKLAALDAERGEVESGRPAILSELPDDLVAMYDRIRAQSGAGAAALTQRNCDGCRLELNVGELTRFRNAADDEVLRCDECGRILVRTAESGL